MTLLGDPKRELYESINEKNKLACAYLQHLGLDGQTLRLQLKESVFPRALTVRHSEERYKQLAKASTHRERFFVTGGDHACTDDVFKAFEYYKDQLKRIKTLRKQKKRQQLMEKVLNPEHWLL